MLSDQRKGAGRKRRAAKAFQQGGQAVLPLPKQQTIIQDRLIETAGLLVSKPEVTFQHSILCQTSLPYRDPGPDVRRWEREQGTARLMIEAGAAVHPETGKFVDIPLPFGTKPRLILAHLNTEAMRTGSPEIEVESSLTAFVKRLGLADHGRNMRTIKDQLTRLSAATIRFGLLRDGGAINVNSQIVSRFDLWFPKDERQRVLWSPTVRLSLDYFESLQAHAVPLMNGRSPRCRTRPWRSISTPGWANACTASPSRTASSSPGFRQGSVRRGLWRFVQVPPEIHGGAAPGPRGLSGRQDGRDQQGPVSLHLAAASRNPATHWND